MKQEHPTLDEAGCWQVVSRDAEERTTWKVRQTRRTGVARGHERVRWKRDDFAHQQSRRSVNTGDTMVVEDLRTMVVEDLRVRNLVQNGRLAKGIHDAAWRPFAALIAWKAACAARRVIAVHPAHTSPDGSGYGHRKTDQRLAARIDPCVSCGLVLDRDRTAAQTIVRVGLHALASA